MFYRYNNICFSEKTNKKKTSFIHYIFAIGVVFFASIVPILIILKLFTQSLPIEHHGPNPNTQLDTIAPKGVLGQDLNLIGLNNDDINRDVGAHLKKIENEKQFQEEDLRIVNEYGIATGGGLNYMDQDTLDHYFSSLQSLGVEWVRWDIDWGMVQKDNPNEYDWKNIDKVIITANKYNIKSLCIITYTPKWASDKNCKSKSRCAPINPKDFAHFAGEVVSRYKDSVKYWEIWNEPNLAFFWSPRPDVKKYAELLKESYLEIKKIDPNAVVLTGGLSSTRNELDGSTAPVDFMSALYDLDYNNYFDAVNIHPYTFPISPSQRIILSNWQQISLIRDMMIKNGESEKKIWITEFGAPTGGPGRSYTINQIDGFKYGTDYMKERAQSDIMIEALSFYNKNFDWMGPFFWYSLHDAGDKKNDTENFFGLLRYDWSKKPAYDVFKEAIANSNKK